MSLPGFGAESGLGPELKAPPAPAARPQQPPEPALVTPPQPAARPAAAEVKPSAAKSDGTRTSGAAPQFTITLAGDTGYSPHMAPVNPRTSTKGGRTLTFEQAFAPMAKDVNGEINFVNVETVVTDRNDLTRDTKGQSGPFNFRSHPNGFAHLVKKGVNLFSLANNHSMDFGEEGLRETLKHVAALEKSGLDAHAGIGLNREEASRPKLVKANGADVAFSAIGIVTNNLERHRAGEDRPGQIAYRFADDFRLTVDRLKQAKSDYRMLSIHYGVEGQVRADADQLTNWRREAKDGVDLIVGHHAHVVRGVEMTSNGALIFYGLGNFMHHGTADITGNHVCRTYGLFARVHVAQDANGKWRTRAVEAIPVTDTHIAPRRYASVEQSHYRVHALNYLGETLDSPSSGAKGMRFTPQVDGSGLYCVEGAATDGGRIGALCKGWKPAPPVPASLRGAIASSCVR
jgi:poly-gamma-glutamate synthesis protein (capsule biosynthesis protein)